METDVIVEFCPTKETEREEQEGGTLKRSVRSLDAA